MRPICRKGIRPCSFHRLTVEGDTALASAYSAMVSQPRSMLVSVIGGLFLVVVVPAGLQDTVAIVYH